MLSDEGSLSRDPEPRSLRLRLKLPKRRIESVMGDEQRHYPRTAVEAVAWIEWHDQTGMLRHVRARCLDISRGGLKLQVPLPIPLGTDAVVGLPKADLISHAVVRHWDTKEHTIGIQLVDGDDDATGEEQ